MMATPRMESYIVRVSFLFRFSKLYLGWGHIRHYRWDTSCLGVDILNLQIHHIVFNTCGRYALWHA